MSFMFDSFEEGAAESVAVFVEHAIAFHEQSSKDDLQEDGLRLIGQIFIKGGADSAERKKRALILFLHNYQTTIYFVL